MVDPRRDIRRTVVAIAATLLLLAAGFPTTAGAADQARPSSRCPDDHVLVSKARLRAGDGTLMGTARLLAGTSSDGSPGFCFEVIVRPRFRQPYAPLRKKLSVSSPRTQRANVVGITESAREQHPVAQYASFFDPGTTARAKTVLRVGRMRAEATLRGAI